MQLIVFFVYPLPFGKSLLSPTKPFHQVLIIVKNYLSRNGLLALVVFLLLFPIAPTFGQSSSGFVVTRLNNGQPIIDQAIFAAVGVEEDGGNINGPSLMARFTLSTLDVVRMRLALPAFLAPMF